MRSEDRDTVKLQEGAATGNRKPFAHFPARLLGSSLSLSPSTVSHSPEDSDWWLWFLPALRQGCLGHKSQFPAWVRSPSWPNELLRAKGRDTLCRHGYWSLSTASKEDTLITVCDQELETNPEWVWAPHKERKNDQIWANISKVIGILTKKDKTGAWLLGRWSKRSWA